MKKLFTFVKEIIKADKDVYITALIIVCAFFATALFFQPRDLDMWSICHDCDITHPPTFSDDYEAK